MIRFWGMATAFCLMCVVGCNSKPAEDVKIVKVFKSDRWGTGGWETTLQRADGTRETRSGDLGEVGERIKAKFDD